MLTDAELVLGFEASTLPVAVFGHREHLRVAWLYLRAAPFESAAFRFCTHLRRFAEAHGKPGLYHETITWAYLVLINERRHASEDLDFEAFARRNSDLFDNKGGALAELYDAETLRSERARRVFVLPTQR